MEERDREDAPGGDEVVFLAWWGRTKEEILPGWAICDGLNGTPDLREKFVRCAYSDATRPPGTQGGSEIHDHGMGSASHAHSTRSYTHSHNMVDGDDWKSGTTHRLGDRSHDHGNSDSKSHGHPVGNGSSLPTYKELIIIGYTGDTAPSEAPTGTIAMWSGSIAGIPAGWALCDGGGGSPDLRDKFLKGSDQAGTTGGGTSHVHSLSSNGSHRHYSALESTIHQHGKTGYPTTGPHYYPGSKAIDDVPHDITIDHRHRLNYASSHNHGGLQSAAPLPPYYTLAFIIKEAA